MQTIKTAKGDGFVYTKPKGYKPIKRHSNDWHFADLSKNVSEQVLAIGQEYNRRIKEGRIKHKNRYPVQLQKYFYFLYLTGSRRMEPTMMPLSIKLENVKGRVVVKITKVNEKHKSPDGSGPRIMTQAIPIFNEAEQWMWNFITDGGTELNPRHIFQFENWKSTSKENLSGLIKTNFKTDLKDPRAQRVHKNAGITPHILRHMRDYNVKVNYGVSDDYAVMLFGWNDSSMVYYYVDVKETVSFNDQVKMLEKDNLLTDLKIDLLKSLKPA